MATSKSTAKAKSTRPSATTAARKAASGAAKSAAKGAAKGAARTAAKGATQGAKKTVAVSGDTIGRGTRWTEEQVALLLETVLSSSTAKEAFEHVAHQIGKNVGTVSQKYYNLQKAAGTPAGTKRTTAKGRPAGRPATRPAGAASSGLPTAAALRVLTVDDLTGLALRVKDEIDRRRSELDAASKALKG